MIQERRQPTLSSGIEDPQRDRATVCVRREAGALLAYFKRRVTDPEDAADLVAQTLMVVWKRVEALPLDETEARMWMFGIARHVHLGYLRGRRRHIALADKLRGHLMHSGRESVPAIDGRYLDLTAAIAALPVVDQEIVRLLHWDGLSLEQVARHLGKPASTIRSRYHRARAHLRRSLDDFPGSPPQALLAPHRESTATQSAG